MVHRTKVKWDVFISHASEDKEDFVRPLANTLISLGVSVWYDEFTLSIGDSLSRSIDKGLSRARFGLVVISPAFIAKRWPEYELRSLVAREGKRRKIILPVWHGVEHAQVLSLQPGTCRQDCNSNQRGIGNKYRNSDFEAGSTGFVREAPKS